MIFVETLNKELFCPIIQHAPAGFVGQNYSEELLLMATEPAGNDCS
jgi:hypothetical protein